MRQEINEARMTKKRAFISFDFDHDEDLRTMLAVKQSTLIRLLTSSIDP